MKENNLEENQKNLSNSFEEIVNNIEKEQKSKKSFLKFSLSLFMIITFVGGSIFIYEKYFSEEAKQKQNYEKYLKFIANYEKAMTEDTYGGKTPEETLKLFIDALKKEDLDLASKYFILKENGLPDPKWKEGLINAKKEGRLSYIIDVISRAKKDDKASSLENNVWFVVYKNNSKELEADIQLEFNPYAKIWKIESL